MATFCETLKGLNPELQFTYGSGERYMRYLNYWNENAREFTSDESDWRKDYHEFCREHIHPERLMRLLFSNQNYVQQHVNQEQLMMGLYWIASDIQNTELDLSFYDIFEKEELFDIWQEIIISIMFVMELVLGERRLYKELLFLYLKIYWILQMKPYKMMKWLLH